MAGPPAGQYLAVDPQRLGEPGQVLQDVFQCAASRIAVQKVRADPGQAVDEVELGERREVPAVDACLGLASPVVR